MPVLLELQHGPECVVFELWIVVGLDIFSSPILQIVHIQQFLTGYIHRRVVGAVGAGVNLGKIKPMFDEQNRIRRQMRIHVIDVHFHVLHHLVIVAFRRLAVVAQPLCGHVMGLRPFFRVGTGDTRDPLGEFYAPWALGPAVHTGRPDRRVFRPGRGWNRRQRIEDDQLRRCGLWFFLRHS